MSTIDDASKLVQDIVSPDLKAIVARLDALEKTVKTGFDASERSVQLRFDAADQRVDAVEKFADVRHEMLIQRMDSGFAAMDAKFAAADAKFERILNAIDVDRRLMRLEAAVVSQSSGTELDKPHA